jgi:hypothetical protein
LYAKWDFDPKFTIVTTNMTANDTFRFYIYSAGTFVVDWDDGNLQSYTLANAAQGLTLSHTYTTAGVHNIRVGGLATAYSPYDGITPGYTGAADPAIFFYNSGHLNGTPTKIAQVTGSMGAVFPTLGPGLTLTPRFYRTFDGATNLTSVSSTLFNGVTGSGTRMFGSTFNNCSKLTAIPTGLFSGVSGSANGMFSNTFKGCSKITTVPSGLFDGVTGAAEALFADTFNGCSKLATIPTGLFRNVSGGAKYMFSYTFGNCPMLSAIPTGLFNGVTVAAEEIFAATFMNDVALTSIPNGLFANVTGGAPGVFFATFYGCSGLNQSIPSNLFAGITTAAENIFATTFAASGVTGRIPADLFANVTGSGVNAFAWAFYGCTGLTGSIPGNLFRGINAAAQGEFTQTFKGATNLSGYVPATLFAGLNHGTATDLMTSVFENTGLAEECPCGTHQYITGYEDSWSNKVSCEIGVKPNEMWYDGQCVELCGAGITHLKTSTGINLPILSTKLTQIALNFKYNDQVCYVPMETGKSTGTINLRFNNTNYHTGAAVSTPPANWDPQP